MARVRRRDTGPELMLRRALHAAGLRFRVDRKIEGVRADVVFPTERTAIFIDGCFWHGCPIHATRPKSNTGYWLPKLEENRKRDLRQTERLTSEGWAVIRLWEHECCPPASDLIERLRSAILARRNPSA
jgi:DNA mismatch endonuclease (patch repair protein)